MFYGPLLRGGPLQDDWGWFNAVRVNGILGVDHSNWGFWRPLLSIVFWAVWSLFGVAPVAFHLLNVCLTAITAVAIRSIWIQLSGKIPRAHFYGLACGVLFVIWPSHPETVAWIAGLTDGLSTCLGMLGIWAYVSAVKRTRGGALLVVAALLIFSSILAKESGIVYGPICLLALIPLEKPPARRQIALHAVYFVVIVPGAFLSLRQAVLHGIGGYHNSLAPLSAAMGTKLLLNLSHCYVPLDHLLADRLGPATTLLAAGAIIGGIFLAAFLCRSPGAKQVRRLALVALGCSVITLLPGLAGNLTISFEENYRWSYGGTAFAVMVLVALVAIVTYRCLWQVAALSLLVCCCALQLVWNLLPWKRAGDISNSFVRFLESHHSRLRQGARVFVLAAPYAIDTAPLFAIGLRDIPYVIVDGDIRVIPLLSVSGLQSDDDIEASRLGKNVYQVQVRLAKAPHKAPLHAFVADPRVLSWFEVGNLLSDAVKPSPTSALALGPRGSASLLNGVVVRLPNWLKPGNPVLIINEEGVEVVR